MLPICVSTTASFIIHVSSIANAPVGIDGFAWTASDSKGNVIESGSIGNPKKESGSDQIPAEILNSKGSTDGCDISLWHHIYHPSRLQVVDPCKAVTGTISEIRTEKDGDLHILLAPDREYASLVNSQNDRSQNGNLVLEVICQKLVSQADAIDACSNFSNYITIPPIGSHVNVLGTYVLDLQHGSWAEIHPVSAISVIQDNGPQNGDDNNTGNNSISNSQSKSGTQKQLAISILVDKDPITRGSVQTIVVVIADKASGSKIQGVSVSGVVTYASGYTQKNFGGATDGDGAVEYSWRIGGNSTPGTFYIDVQVQASGYEAASASGSFEVVPAS